MRPVTSAERPADSALDGAVARAATGDVTALAEVLDGIHPIVAHWCRAEFARSAGVERADAVAAEICRTVLTQLPGATRPLLTLVGDEIRRRSKTLRKPPVASADDMVAKLPNSERTTLTLRTVVGLSVADTACALDTTTSVVLLRQHRAMNRLRRWYARRPDR